MILFPSSSRRPRVTLGLAVAATLTAAGAARAQTAAAPAATPVAHVSSFDAPPNGARNPFWPIGWMPSAVVAPTQVAAQQLDVKAENFVVTTISVDYPPLAIINGKSYGVGEQIPVTPDKREFVTVRQILDGLVVLDYRGHELRATPGGAGLVRKAK